MAKNLLPNTDNASDLGATDKHFKAIYVNNINNVPVTDLCVNSDYYDKTAVETKINDAIDAINQIIENSGAGIKEWTPDTSYKKDSVVIVDKDLYVCKTAHTSGEEFEATNWTHISGSQGCLWKYDAETDQIVPKTKEEITAEDIGTDEETVNSLVTSLLDGAVSRMGSGISEWSSGIDYSIGTIVIYNDVLYKCNTAHTSGEEFNSTYWVTLSNSSGGGCGLKYDNADEEDEISVTIRNPNDLTAEELGSDGSTVSSMINESLNDNLNNNFNFLKRNFTYAAGDIAYHADLPSWGYLECTTAGVTAETEPTIPTTENETLTDGTAVFKLGRKTGFLPLTGGTITGVNSLHLSGAITNSDSSYTIGISGSGYSSEKIYVPLLWLYDNDHPDANAKGRFQLRATDGTNAYDLIGSNDGKLKWRNSSFITTKTYSMPTVTVPANSAVHSTLNVAISGLSIIGAVVSFYATGNTYFATWATMPSAAGGTTADVIFHNLGSTSASLTAPITVFYANEGIV